MKIKIIVATHKMYRMPNDDIYLPIQVGKRGKESIGFKGDDSGENISQLNFCFNEMTAAYWAWKNLECDYVGLVHYRRYFTNKKLHKFFCKDKFELISSKENIEDDLNECDIILPEKRKYFIETIKSHYEHLPYTYNSDLKCLHDVLEEKYPEYIKGFNKVMKRTWAHMFNMFIMKRRYFDEYAEWAFSVLFDVNSRICWNGRKVIEARLYISEFLLDTWIETKGYKYKEKPILFMEKQHWIKKIIVFIKRKYAKG